MLGLMQIAEYYRASHRDFTGKTLCESFSHLKSTNCVVSKKCALLLFMLRTSRFSANEITCSVTFTGHNVLIQGSFPKGLRRVRVFWFITPNKEGRLCCVV